jgi:hypothetical protein
VCRFAELTLVWLVCLGMVLPAPGVLLAEPFKDKGIARSQDPAQEAKTAQAAFLKANILRSETDSVKQYLFDSRTQELTDMGQLMFNMLSQAKGTNRQAELKELTKQLEAMTVGLRSAGGYSTTKQKEVVKGLKDIGKRYEGLVKEVGKDVESSDLFSAHIRLNTMFDAMAQREQAPLGQNDVRMHRTETGTYVYNLNGDLLYKFNNNRVITFNSQLLKQQKAINTRLSQKGTFGMPPDCPKRVRESGRYQYDLLLFSWCDQKVRVDGINDLKRRQRVILMAALVGHQLGSEINNPSKLKALEKQLEKEQITSGTWVPGWAAKYGRKYGVFDDGSFPMAGDLIKDKFVKYSKYLDQLNDALAVYKDRINNYKGADTVTNEQLKQLKTQERLVSRFMALTQMEALRVQTEFMLETLSYEVKKTEGGDKYLKRVDLAPDSVNFLSAVRSAGLSGDKQKKLFEQWHKMAQRFARLEMVYDNIEVQLNRSDLNSDLKKPNHALMAAEAELQVLQRDYSNLMQMPQILKFAKDQTKGSWWHWTAPVTRFTVDLTHKVTNGAVGGKYVNARKELDKITPHISGVVDLLAEGKYRDAAVSVVNADASAHATHMKLPVGTQYDEIKLTDRAAAVLAKYQENLGHVQKIHTYSSIPIDIVKWSAFLGVGSRAAGWASRGTYQLVAGRSLSAGKHVGAFRNGVGEVFKHMAVRFETLGPEFKTSLLKDTGYRFANSMARITSFATMIAPIGGTMTVIQHWGGGEKSQFEGAGEAFVQGAVHTAKWAAENPFILFINIPYTAFNGTRLEGAAQSIANKGLVGNLHAAGVKSIQGTWNIGRWMKAKVRGQAYTKATFGDTWLGNAGFQGEWVNNWLKRRAAGGAFSRAVGGTAKFVRGGLTNLDHVGKFWAFGQTAGYVGHHLGYNLRSLQIRTPDESLVPEDDVRVNDGIGSKARWFAEDYFSIPKYEENQNRRIKRSIASGHKWAESYIWMLMPMHPSQGSEVQDAQKSRMGVEQYLKSKDEAALLRLANSSPREVEGAKPLKMLYHQRLPLFQRVMTIRFGRRLKTNEFYSTRESIEEATKKLLRKEIEKKTGADPHSSPWKYLEMLSIEDKSMLGRLRMREYTRNALVEQAEAAFKLKPELAKRIIDAKPSSHVKGVGTLSRPLLEEVALVVRHANKTGGKGNPFVGSKYKATVEKANQILEPYLQSRVSRDAAAIELRTALNKLGKRSKALESFLDNLTERVQEWSARAQSKQSNVEHYTEIMKQAENEIAQTKNLGKGEAEAVKAAIKYLRSVETRFNFFNNGKYFSSRSGEAFDVAMNKAKQTSNSARLEAEITAMREKVTGFMREKGFTGGDGKLTAQGKNRDIQVSENPGGDKFTQLVAELDGRAKVLKADPSISPSESAILGELVKNVDAAPWLLRNSKGYNLKGWRPVQFESLTWFTRALLQGNMTKGETIRIFLKLKTGGGKTLVATEGMWSFIEADARAQGRKPVLLTPQENLVQQMEAELKATRNYGDIEVTTWSKLTGDQAAQKVGSGGKKAKKLKELYIVSDEYDAPFLAPATTIGQQLATISRFNEGLNILKRTGKRMSSVINNPHGNLNSQLKHYTSTMRMHANELADHPGHRQLSGGVAKLERAVAELHRLQTRTGKPSATQLKAIEAQKTIIKQLIDGRPGLTGLTKMVEGMKIENPWGKKGRASIETGIQTLKTQAQGLLKIKDGPGISRALSKGGSVREALRAIETLVAKETGNIQSASPSARALASETARFRTRLEGLTSRVSAQNQVLKTAAKNIQTQSSNLASLRTQLQKQKAGTKGHREAQQKVHRAEIELRRTVDSVKEVLSNRSQAELRTFAEGDQVGSGHLRDSARSLRMKLGELTAEVSPAQSRVNKISRLINQHVGRQKNMLRTSASREILHLADRQSRIVHSRPPEAAHSLKQVKELGKQVLETIADPAKHVASRQQKPGLLDRLRGRDALRSEVEMLISEQQQALNLSRLNTRQQAQELTKIASKLRAIEAGPNAGKVEALAKQIRELRGQREVLLKEKRSTSAIDRQIKKLTADKTSLSRTPFADEVQLLAESLGREATVARADKIDAKIQSLNSRLAGHAKAKVLVGRLEGVQSGLRIRETLAENTRQIRHELTVRKEGWRDRVRDLVAKRNGLFEKSVSHRNAVYEVYEGMMKSMAGDRYGFLSHQSSPLAELLHQKKVIESPEVASRTIRRQAAALVKRLGEVKSHYRRVHADAEANLQTLKSGKASASQIEAATARVKDAKLRLSEASNALAEAKSNYHTTKAIADRMKGLIDYAPEGKGPKAEALKTQRAELFRLVEQLTAKNIQLGKMKANKVDPKSAEGKKIKALEAEAQQMQSRVEGLHKQVSQLNREVAKEAIEAKLVEAEKAEARAEFKENSAKSPEMLKLARRELTLARFEKGIAKQLMELQVTGVKKANVEFQSLKQTRDATFARRQKLNEILQKELQKPENKQNKDKTQNLGEQIEWLDTQMLEIGKHLYQFQRKLAPGYLEMAQNHVGTSARKWGSKLDTFIGRNVEGSMPTELVRLRNLRTELMQKRAPLANERGEFLRKNANKVENRVDLELSRSAELQKLNTSAKGSVRSLQDAAKGLDGKGLPKTVRDAAKRFETAAGESRKALDGGTAQQRTNSLGRTHGEAKRLVGELRKALENPNLPKVQRKLLTEKVQALEKGVTVVESASTQLGTKIEAFRRTVRPKDAASPTEKIDARLLEIDKGIRALEGLRQPLRSMGGQYDPAVTARNQQHPALEVQRRGLLNDPTKAKAVYERKLKRLTSKFTRELNDAFAAEPFLAPEVRAQMFWNINGMYGWAKGIPVIGKYLFRGRPSTWVQKELVNMGTGHHNETSDVRFDGQSKKVVPIHLGEWMPTMDIGTRRFWELHFKTGLTMPYEHQALVNMRNYVIDTPKLPIIGFSGTLGKVLLSQLKAKSGGFQVVGKGSPSFPNVRMEVVPSASHRFKLVADSIVESIRSPQTKRITVVNHANSKDLKQMQRYLLETGLVSKRELVSIFSDTVALGENYHKANVRKTMNLGALDTGRARVVLMDTRVAGRGLDLNWKGGGYKKVDVYFMDPHKISQVHEVQAGGRVDADRLLPGAERRFTRVLDIASAKNDPAFQEAMLFHPQFRSIYYELMNNPPPTLKRSMAMRGVKTADWQARHDWIMSLPKQHPIRLSYFNLFTDYVRKNQLQEEVNQLKSSRFLEGANLNVPAHQPVLHWAPKLSK